MYILQNGALLVAGRTVTYKGLEACASALRAVIVEVRDQHTAELDNGKLVPLESLVLVPTGEQWLPIMGFTDQYLLSSHGKVVSLFYNRSGRQRLLRVMSPHRYPSVSLHQGSFVTQAGLNRLVAQHFLPPPAEARFRHVVPKDGNHLNLRVENLQWVDQQERDDMAVVERFHRCGASNSQSKLTPKTVGQIRLLSAQGSNNQQLAAQFGVSRPAISQIVRRLSWRSV
jgi:hypothetical protein